MIHVYSGTIMKRALCDADWHSHRLQIERIIPKEEKRHLPSSTQRWYPLLSDANRYRANFFAIWMPVGHLTKFVLLYSNCTKFCKPLKHREPLNAQFNLLVHRYIVFNVNKPRSILTRSYLSDRKRTAKLFWWLKQLLKLFRRKLFKTKTKPL